MAAPIQVVAPYAELAELSRGVIADLAADAAVTTGDLVAGLENARALVAEGVEVVVATP